MQTARTSVLWGRAAALQAGPLDKQLRGSRSLPTATRIAGLAPKPEAEVDTGVCLLPVPAFNRAGGGDLAPTRQCHCPAQGSSCTTRHPGPRSLRSAHLGFKSKNTSAHTGAQEATVMSPEK